VFKKAMEIQNGTNLMTHFDVRDLDL